MRRDSVRSSWRRLRAAGAWAALGDGIVAVALPLLALDTTRDPIAVAGVIAALYVPWALMNMFGPALLAGADRRTVMGGLDTARAVAMGWVGLDALAGNVSLPTLYGVAVISGLAVTLVDDAERDTASVIGPAVRGVEPDGRLAAAEVVADGFIGLPIGAVLFELLTPLPFFAVAFTSTMAALLALSVGHGPDPRQANRRTVRVAGELREAFAELFAEPAGGTLVLVAAGTSLLGSVVLGPLVLLAVDDLRMSALGFGLLLTAFAGGSLLGGLMAPGAARRSGPRPVAVVSLVAGAAAYGAASATNHAVLAGALLAGGAMSGMAVTVTLAVARRRGEPAARALHLVSWAAIPVGALGGGAVADGWGLHAPLVVAAVGFVVLLPLALFGVRPAAATVDRARLAKMG